MNCPICHQSVPFGLAMHMIAAHGAKSAEYQQRSSELQKAATPNTSQGLRRKGKRRKPPGKRQLKYPTRSKLS